MSKKTNLRILYTFSGSHPVQKNYKDSIGYTIKHNLGNKPMVYEVIMHRDDPVDGQLKFVNDKNSLNSAQEFGAFTVTDVTLSALSLHIYRAGLQETEDFTFNIYGYSN